MDQFRWTLCWAATLFILAATGCQSDRAAFQDSRAGASRTADAHSHGQHSHGGEQSTIDKALARLPAADRQAAAQQKTCPVTDEPLGSMGVPIKVSVKGQDVFVCCEGCKDAVLDEPDLYLAKLKH